MTKNYYKIRKIDAFINKAVGAANDQIRTAPIPAKGGTRADQWNTYFHAEMNRLTVGAGLRVP